MSFLKDKKIALNINGFHTEFVNLKTGIPQGSSISALLFNLFINDLMNLQMNSEILCYADDIVLTICAYDVVTAVELLRRDLEKLNSWFTANKMQINIEKTKLINFHIRNKPDIPNIKLHLQHCRSTSCQCPVIEEVSSYKYIGTTIDSRLK